MKDEPETGIQVVSQDAGLVMRQVRLPADRNPVATYLMSLSEKTSRPTMESALECALRAWTPEGVAVPRLESFAWERLGYQHLNALRTILAAKYEPATANKILTGVRRVLRECRRLGLMTEEQRAAAVDVKPIEGSSPLAGRAAGVGEIDAAEQVARGHGRPIDLRNVAILATMVRGGLRRIETAKCMFEGYDRSDPERPKLDVHGKRNKRRDVVISTKLASRIDDWIAVRGTEPGPLFYAAELDGRLTTRPLTGSGVYSIVASIASRTPRPAGTKPLTPHDLRRTFITRTLAGGADALVVAKIVGHEDPATTMRYDRRPADAQRAAANNMDDS